MGTKKNFLAPDPVVDEIYSRCLLVRTRLIARVVTNIYDEALRPFGINSTQFALLVIISRRGPASRADIGRFMHQDRSTLSRNLKLIDAEGWIEEVENPAGGRSRPIVLTKAGTDIVRAAASAWRLAQVKAKASLGQGGTKAITDIGDRMFHSD
jgi:DNA-binding MarR family transcriptional regulator